MSQQKTQKRVGGLSPIKSPAQSTQWGEFLGLLRSLFIFLAIAYMLRASVVEAFKIPSASMEPTLEIGDHILVNKLSYGFRLPILKKTLFDFRVPKRDDVVVFTLPDDPATPDIDESDTNIIKRVVGLPGDVVRVIGTQLFINGEIYERDSLHAHWRRGGVKDFEAAPVPPGKVLLLGDNRDFSKDSRYWPDPFLDVSRIKGRAFIVYWNSLFLFKRMFGLIR